MELPHENGASPDRPQDGPNGVGPAGQQESPRDTWTTPEIIVRSLLRLWPNGADLDPCSNERSIVPAAQRIALPQDGLEHRGSWRGRVFVNPPYSHPHPWVDACDEHGRAGGEVVALLRCDPSVAWFKRVWGADVLCFPNFRVQFDPPPGVKVSGNTGPNVLAYWGPEPARFEWAFRSLGKAVRP